MKCSVCGKLNKSMQCPKCGFDSSRDYERYPTFGVVGKATADSTLRKQWLEKQKTVVSLAELVQQPVEGAEKPDRTLPIWLVAGVCAATMALGIWSCTSMSGIKTDPTDLGESVQMPLETTLPPASTVAPEFVIPTDTGTADSSSEEPDAEVIQADMTVPAENNAPEPQNKPKDPSVNVTIEQLSVKNAPNKTVYSVGERLDTSGLSLEAVYSNGVTERIDSGFACAPMTLNTAGNTEIQVTYKGKTASFTVKVQSVWSDWVTKLPDGVNASTYEIQEKTQYASSRITKWNRYPDGYDDISEYDFYDHTSFINLDSGWSEWVAEGDPSPAEKEPRLCYSYEVQRENAVQYRYRERDIFTDEFASWSGWQLEEVTATDDRQVETRNAYRVRTIIVHSTRHYYQVEDGLWENPVYGDTPIQKDDNTAVKTRTVYRYREKVD